MSQIITQDPTCLALLKEASRIASFPINVFIQGESGTGKELLAQRIHQEGCGAQGNFVAINCAAIPEGLLESELFGYEKGAFTGALNQAQGKIEQAHQGTLFLDEIGDLPLNLQPKLLRFLETKSFERIGGRKTVHIDVRVISATHQPIEQMIHQKLFRADLYYRLAELSFVLPPLRERHCDLFMLSRHFLQHYAKLFGCAPKTLNHEAMMAIEQHVWNGNVRELQNRIKRALLLAKQPMITPQDLGLCFEEDRFQGFDLKSVRDAAEQEAIARALAYTNGNVAKAADLLGITRQTLYTLLEKHEPIEECAS